MKVPIITLFNNKSGVGKTLLVYHLAWILADHGKRVLVVDLDPQARLTAMFLDDDQLEILLKNDGNDITVYWACQHIFKRESHCLNPVLYCINKNFYLLPGDIALSTFEEPLAKAWLDFMSHTSCNSAYRKITAFWQVMQMASQEVEADLLLVDVGPNLGAINRSALLSTTHVIIPLGADLFSLQGLKNLGPTLHSWRSLWKKRLNNWENPEFDLPAGRMEPVGYLCQQYSVRLKRPVKAYDKWVNRIPFVYRESVLNETGIDMKPENDPHCLATIKHFRSLIPIGQEHRKPIFQLSPADGAIGSHANAVQEAYRDFRELAKKIAAKTGISM